MTRNPAPGEVRGAGGAISSTTIKERPPGSLIVVKGAQSNQDWAKVLLRKDSRRRRFLDISTIELQRKGRRLAEMSGPVFNLDRQRKREIIQPGIVGRGA